MVKLIRDKRTGDYFTEDRRFQVERGSVGWNVNERNKRGWYDYGFSCDTLKEVRESLPGYLSLTKQDEEGLLYE